VSLFLPQTASSGCSARCSASNRPENRRGRQKIRRPPISARGSPVKAVVWVGPTRSALKAFPRPMQRAVGLALYATQLGETPPDAKPLKGFGGAGVFGA